MSIYLLVVLLSHIYGYPLLKGMTTNHLVVGGLPYHF
nr:MAG TPA: hypothetical protein [Bacteriophage sp.]